MARERIAHAYGPFPHGRKLRVVTVAADGTRGRRSFETEREAQDYRDAFVRAAEDRTVGMAMEEYLAHLRVHGGRDRGGLRDSSVRTARFRLTAFFRLREGDRALASMTPSAVRRLYNLRVGEVAPDTQRGELVLVGAAFDWWTRQGWTRGNPAEGIEPVGSKHARKAQPRVNEARLFLAAALGEMTTEGLAAAITLTMGLRAGEVCGVTVRDVDDAGRLLWVTEGKTDNSVRRVRVPAVIRERLLELCAGRDGTDRVFPDMTRHGLYHHVKRLCVRAGITEFGPHAMRKAFVTLAIEGTGGDGGGSLAQTMAQVQRDTGHGVGSTVTTRHYAAAGAVDSAAVTRMEELLEGPVESGGNLGTNAAESFPAGEKSEVPSGVEVTN